MGPLATVGAGQQLSHPACCCQTVSQKLSTDMFLLLCLFVVQQISVHSSERAFSPPYGGWFFPPSRLPLQDHYLQGCRLGSLNGFAFCHVDLFLRGVTFVNGLTSVVAVSSSRHDDSPRVGTSLGRLTHASTSLVKTRQPAPTQAAAICKPQHIAQLS